MKNYKFQLPQGKQNSTMIHTLVVLQAISVNYPSLIVALLAMFLPAPGQMVAPIKLREAH